MISGIFSGKDNGKEAVQIAINRAVETGGDCWVEYGARDDSGWGSGITTVKWTEQPSTYWQGHFTFVKAGQVINEAEVPTQGDFKIARGNC